MQAWNSFNKCIVAKKKDRWVIQLNRVTLGEQKTKFDIKKQSHECVLIGKGGMLDASRTHRDGGLRNNNWADVVVRYSAVNKQAAD